MASLWIEKILLPLNPHWMDSKMYAGQTKCSAIFLCWHRAGTARVFQLKRWRKVVLKWLMKQNATEKKCVIQEEELKLFSLLRDPVHLKGCAGLLLATHYYMIICTMNFPVVFRVITYLHRKLGLFWNICRKCHWQQLTSPQKNWSASN